MFDTFLTVFATSAPPMGRDLVRKMQDTHRELARLQARFYQQMLAVAHAGATVMPDIGYEYAPEEIGAALTWTRRRAESEFTFAWELAELPQVAQALAAGVIDLAKAKVIVHGLCGIEPGTAQQVAEQILVKAERRTTGQIRAQLRRLIITTDPVAASDRYLAGLEERKIWLEGNDDGTANLHLYGLAPDQAAMAFDRIDTYARALSTTDETRTLDQLRTDVASDLLLGCLDHQNRGKRPIVDIRIDLETLLGLNDDPGEIPGWGPVIADIARQVTEQHSEWRWHVVDDHRIVANGTTRRRPTRTQRRRIETRYPHCVFPGCRTPSIHSDLDHRQRWIDGGPTEDQNLAPLCEHNHGTKDNGGWKVDLIDPHTFQWTSPLDLQYLVEIEPP